MLKLFFVIIPAFVLFVTSPFINSSQKILIDQEFPSNINPGQEFIVKLAIHKGELSGFARLQQFLPAGFTAEEIDTHGGDFLFEDNSVKFIWVQLPTETDFTVSYKITPDKSMTGRQVINGVFVYIEDDKTQREPLAPVEIVVGEATAQNSSKPEVTRKLYSIAPEKGEYRVELKFLPNNLNESAQFTDEIPDGFTAEVIDAHGASFTFENHSANFSWEKFPADPEFVISYLVRSGKQGASPVINGVLVYGDTTETDDQSAMKETTSSEDFSSGEKGEAEASTAEASNTQSASNTNAMVASRMMPVPQVGVYYKVQISATRKSSVKNTAWFGSKFHISSEVELTYHEGWKKYLIGSFEAYNDAKALRKQTQETVSDAFVVAYENGTRISLSEALRNKSVNQ